MSLRFQTKQLGRLGWLAQKARLRTLLFAQRAVRHFNNHFRPWLRAARQVGTFLGLAMIALAWAGIALHLSIEERSALQAAKQNTDNLARVFEEQIVRLVEGTDNILLSLQAAHAKNPTRFDIETARIYLSDLILQISEIGPDGFLKPGTLALAPGARIDLNDREHFRVHLNLSLIHI